MAKKFKLKKASKNKSNAEIKHKSLNNKKLSDLQKAQLEDEYEKSQLYVDEKTRNKINKKAAKKARKKQAKIEAQSQNDKMRFAATDASSWRKAIDNSSTQTAEIIPNASSVTNTKEDLSKIAATLNETRSQQEKVNLRTFFNQQFLSTASVLLAIATGIAILFGLAMFYLPGGVDAVYAIGGIVSGEVPVQTAKIVFLLDTLFPITFGAGFALLATAFQMRGNRPLVRIILSAILIAVIADFSENALVFKLLMGQETSALVWPLTVIKYATLGFASVLLSAVIYHIGFLGKLCLLFLRFVFPVSIAVLVSGIAGKIGSDIIGATFPVGLLLLAIYAATLASKRLS